MSDYTDGFVAKCAERGVDPEVLVKQAQRHLPDDALSQLYEQDPAAANEKMLQMLETSKSTGVPHVLTDDLNIEEQEARSPLRRTLGGIGGGLLGAGVGGFGGASVGSSKNTRALVGLLGALLGGGAGAYLGSRKYPFSDQSNLATDMLWDQHDPKIEARLRAL